MRDQDVIWQLENEAETDLYNWRYYSENDFPKVASYFELEYLKTKIKLLTLAMKDANVPFTNDESIMDEAIEYFRKLEAK